MYRLVSTIKYYLFDSSIKQLPLLLILLLLSSCGFFDGLHGASASRDRAPSTVLDPVKIKSAIPRVEPRSRGGNKSPYTVLGKRYKVVEVIDGYRERGDASWYGVKFHGRTTSNGETYDMYKMTAAHKHLPLPSYVRVTNLKNKKQIIVRVNDRGPFHEGRIIDLSYAAATKLDILKKGTAPVEIEWIDPKKWLAERKKNKPSKRALTLAKNNDAEQIQKQTEAYSQSGDTDSILTYLQVAAYQRLDAARAAQNRLLTELKGDVELPKYNVVIHPSEDSSLYRVRIGPVTEKRHITELKQHRALSSFVSMYAVTELR